MSDLESRIVREFERRSREVAPAEFSSHQLRRVRRRQSATIAVAGSVLVAVALGAVATLATIRSSTDRAQKVAGTADGSINNIYVVDAGSHRGEASRVVALEASGGNERVVRAFPADSAATAAVSPDGRRVFVASDDVVDGDTLAVVDTASGETLHEFPLQQPGKPQGRTQWLHPVGRSLAVAADGRWVYVLQNTPGSEYQQEYFVGTVDAFSGQLLPESASIEGCGPGGRTLLPLPGERELAVLCQGSHDVRLLQIAESGLESSSIRIPLPETPVVESDPDLRLLAGGVLSPSADKLYAVTLSGRLFVVDLASRTVVLETDLTLPASRHVSLGQVLLSPDGERLYLGTGSLAGFDRLSADEIVVVDTSTWSLIDSRVIGQPVFSIALGPGGRHLYGTNFDRGIVVTMDLADEEPTRVLSGIAKAPAIIEVPASRP